MAHQHPGRGLGLKQAGVMLVVSGVVVGVFPFATNGPRGLIYIAGLFAIVGLVLTVAGIMKKAS